MSLVARNLEKYLGEVRTPIIRGVSLTINQGEFVSLVGRSGSGKSSLLYLLSTLDQPDGGSVEVDGVDVHALDDTELDRFRNRKIGFIFQFHYLLAELTALENVLMPARAANLSIDELRAHALSLLHDVGLKGKEDRLPRQMSGGEQQRVAIARAMLLRPAYLFADEPTGALDSVNGEQVMQLLARLNRDYKTTIVFVTHDTTFASRAHRIIRLSDGLLVGSPSDASSEAKP